MAARFITSAPRHELLPAHGLPEVAFAGRSNVGKSSLLGWMLGSPGIVRTSRTPGRTQLLNLFVLDDALALVDLPGYGYAKLPHSQRQGLAAMTQAYLTRRRELRGVVLLLDARREAATDADRQVAAWVMAQRRPLLLAITKADLVPKPQRLQRLRQIERAMGVPPDAGLMCSIKEGAGRQLLRLRLRELGVEPARHAG